jgi:hypothetical protein
MHEPWNDGTPGARGSQVHLHQLNQALHGAFGRGVQIGVWGLQVDGQALEKGRRKHGGNMALLQVW